MKVSGVSPAAGQNNGRSDRKKSLVCEVKKKSKYGKKEEWILIFEKQ
jgi:hypothetical protein